MNIEGCIPLRFYRNTRRLNALHPASENGGATMVQLYVYLIFLFQVLECSAPCFREWGCHHGATVCLFYFTILGG